MKTNEAKKMDLGNNETITIGVVQEGPNQLLALTSYKSKTFKTRKGADSWFARMTGKK